MSVCSKGEGAGGVPSCDHYPWCHDALNLTTQASLRYVQPGPHCTGIPWSCSNLLNLYLGVKGPPPIHPTPSRHEAHTVGKRMVGILLDCFLVSFSLLTLRLKEQQECDRQFFSRNPPKLTQLNLLFRSHGMKGVKKFKTSYEGILLSVYTLKETTLEIFTSLNVWYFSSEACQKCP